MSEKSKSENSKTEMPKAYDPTAHEDAIYARWEASGFFTPENLSDFGAREPFTIIHPPPNATGTLHIGHSMGLALQDAMTRFARMRGRRALWVPGTDHAALATQNKVESLLWKAEKKTRHDVGRAELLRRIDAFVEQNRGRMTHQMRKMGASLDWSREAFTLDEPRSRAVRTVFVKMFRDGLIYRGNRVVNWCPRCASTLSDDEVEHAARPATLYYFKYAHDFPITIASTQPETKLGDTAVAVHPSDERYKKFVGKNFDVAFGGAGGAALHIKIIGEHTVEKDFGTGALGVTPAHSMVDYMMSLAHELPLAHIIGEDGLMTAAAGTAYAGFTVREAREKIVAWLHAENLIEKEETIEQNVPVCSRCETEILPLPKLQWFVDVNKKFLHASGAAVTLKEIMRASVADGDAIVAEKIKIIPERFSKTYFHWIDHLRDWCISRQIWYGHRVPVWYCAGADGAQKNFSEKNFVQKKSACADPIVAVDAPLVCPHCGGGVTQDPDVLDTWFSSGTWTFSTLGWPLTRVIFVRHGEARDNAANIMDDGRDTTNALTKNGRAEVAALAKTLARENAIEIISSPVLRARESAEILSAALDVPVRHDDRIREVGVGDFEKKSVDAFEAARGALNNWNTTAPDGIETRVAAEDRLNAFMADTLREFSGRTVIVVSHGDPIAMMRTYGTEKNFAEFNYPHTAGALVCDFGADGSQTSDLAVYHPTDVLETAYEILFNWVARMILMTQYAVGQVPFRTVYLHGLVRDAAGRKMSKSLGNGIDPLDVIPKYGTDAVRLALLLGQTPGNDSRMSEEKIAGFRNFTNKLWNIARFILAQDEPRVEAIVEGGIFSTSHTAHQARALDNVALTELDQWILSRLAAVTREVTDALEKFEFSRAGETLRAFTWDELADWYLEGAKVEGGKHAVLHVVLAHLLKLWHPFMPFVTEAVWQEAFAVGPEDFLMIAEWPAHETMPLYPAAEEKIKIIKTVAGSIRSLKSSVEIPFSKNVPVSIDSKHVLLLEANQFLIEGLSKSTILFLKPGWHLENQFAAIVEDHTTIYLPKSCAHIEQDDTVRLEAERDDVAHYIARVQEKLRDAEFLSRAPAAVVEKEKTKLRDAEEKLTAIEKRL